MPNLRFSGVALFKNSFGVVPCVREEKKDNTDENRCENITSPALAPRLTDFYKSTDLKLRSYKMCRIKAFQGWVVKAGGEIAISSRLVVLWILSVNTESIIVATELGIKEEKCVQKRELSLVMVKKRRFGIALFKNSFGVAQRSCRYKNTPSVH